MSKYLCLPCGYVFDEAENSTGKKFDDMPINWCCPDCHSGKYDFEKIEEEGDE